MILLMVVLAMAVGPIVIATIYCWSADLLAQVRTERRAHLADPWLKGIPLPKVDDPRWRGDGYDTAWIRELGLTVRRNGNIDLDKLRLGISTYRIGCWRAYAREVLRHVEARKQDGDAEAIARRLLALRQDADRRYR